MQTIYKEQLAFVIDPNDPSELRLWNECKDSWIKDGYVLHTDSTLVWVAEKTNVYSVGSVGVEE